METFNSEVRRSLDGADRAKIDVQHALGYFRRQQSLQVDERDGARAKAQRLEEEVATLQRKVLALESEKKVLVTDKQTLKEANTKVLEAASRMFAYGQAVQTGLAFHGLAVNATSAAPAA